MLLEKLIYMLAENLKPENFLQELIWSKYHKLQTDESCELQAWNITAISNEKTMTCIIRWKICYIKNK